MIVLNNISLKRGAKLLLQSVSLTFYAKQKIGIAGKNGSGKTSLFLLLLHELEAETGELLLAQDLKIVSIAQEMPETASKALDFVIDADSELRNLQLALEDAQKKQDGPKIAALYARFSDLDGFTASARAAKILAGLGFSMAKMQQPVNTLSGGWRMRLNIARALFMPSDVLLLDEPTNHLDLDAVIWLERWLIQYPGMLLLISHDREFLDRVVSHIAHFENKQLKLYTGNYSAFEKQRAANLALQEKSHAKQKQQVAHLQSYIDRFRAKASKARQAQSRIKALEKMQTIMPAHIDSPFSFSFKQPKSVANPLLNMENISFAYADHEILANVCLQINTYDRLALLGVNGTGKSTLMKIIAGKLSPQKGNVLRAQNLKIGYFAQHSLEQLDLNKSALEHLQAIATGEKEVILRKFLGGFAFSGDMTLMPVTNFSGGEKARLSLALIVWQNPNLLLLDEPTNHLDLEMRQALVVALQNYTGAVIIIAHDRFLLRNIVDDYYLLQNKKVLSFKGGLDDYQKILVGNKSIDETCDAQKTPSNKINKKEQRKISATERNQLALENKQIKKIEHELQKTQHALNSLDRQLTEENLHEDANREVLKNLLMQRGKVWKKLQQLEEQWFAVL